MTSGERASYPSSASLLRLIIAILLEHLIYFVNDEQHTERAMFS